MVHATDEQPEGVSLTVPDTEMVSAIREGRDRIHDETHVALGVVLGYEPYARAREVRVKGLLVASLGYHGYIRVPEIDDRMVMRRLNALLKAFYGAEYSVRRTKKGTVFVTHPKLNAITHKQNVGATLIEPGEWWEVPGAIRLDPTAITK